VLGTFSEEPEARSQHSPKSPSPLPSKPQPAPPHLSIRITSSSYFCKDSCTAKCLYGQNRLGGARERPIQVDAGYGPCGSLCAVVDSLALGRASSLGPAWHGSSRWAGGRMSRGRCCHPSRQTRTARSKSTRQQGPASPECSSRLAGRYVREPPAALGRAPRRAPNTPAGRSGHQR
jgi:hypothetical protein